MADKHFADGIFFNPPSERAPDFVLGSISVRPEQFSKWLARQEPNEHGYVRLSIKLSKSNNVYVELDTYKPEQTREAVPGPGGGADDFDDGIPFMRRED